MGVHWIIEEAVFPETAKRVTAALDAQGIPWSRYHDGSEARDLPPPGTCVLFWGSLGAAYGESSVATRWVPGAIGDIGDFSCHAYYPHLGGVLANADAIFTTVGRLTADPCGQLIGLSKSKRVFVRPDSALKQFAGCTLDIAAISLATLDHGFYYEDLDLSILVSEEKRVGREWRL